MHYWGSGPWPPAAGVLWAGVGGQPTFCPPHPTPINCRYPWYSLSSQKLLEHHHPAHPQHTPDSQLLWPFCFSQTFSPRYSISASLGTSHHGALFPSWNARRWGAIKNPLSSGFCFFLAHHFLRILLWATDLNSGLIPKRGSYY